MIHAASDVSTGSLTVTIVGICLAAVLAAFGFLIRQWISSLSDDIHALVRLVDQMADSMRDQGTRITRLETVVSLLDETPSRVRHWLQRQEPPGSKA